MRKTFLAGLVLAVSAFADAATLRNSPFSISGEVVRGEREYEPEVLREESAQRPRFQSARGRRGGRIGGGRLPREQEPAPEAEPIQLQSTALSGDAPPASRWSRTRDGISVTPAGGPSPAPTTHTDAPPPPPEIVRGSGGSFHEELVYYDWSGTCQWVPLTTWGYGAGARACKPGDYGYETPTRRSGYDNRFYGGMIQYADEHGIEPVPAYLPASPAERARGIQQVWNYEGCAGTPNGHHVCWTQEQVAKYWQCASGPQSNMTMVVWEGMNFRMRHIREGSENEDTYLVDNQWSIDRGLCDSYCRDYPSRRGCENFNRRR